MIDRDIQKLIDRDKGIDLGQFEADLWRREATTRAAQGANRRLASWQGLVIAFAVVSSAAAGVSTAMTAAQTRPANVLVPGESLAPSSLLFGTQQ